MNPKRKPTASLNLREIAKLIQKMRKFRGKTQEAVAEELDINYRHLQRIEGGNVDFRLSSLGSIAAALEVEPCFLVNTDGKELFEKVALPCHALILEALPMGILLMDADETVLYRNGMAKEILESAKHFRPGGGAMAELLKNMLEKRKELSPKRPYARWEFTIAAAPAPNLEIRLEGTLFISASGREQVIFLLESPQTPSGKRPVSLARFRWDDLKNIPSGNMRNHRRALKLSQTEAAKRQNMILRYYQKVESGKLDLKLSTILKAAESFGVKPCQLLVDEGLRSSCQKSYPCVASVLDQLPFGVLAASTKGEIAYVNRTYKSFFADRTDWPSLKYCWDVFSDPEVRAHFKSFAEKAFTHPPDPSLPRTMEREVDNGAGRTFRIRSSTDYLYSDDGRILGFVAIGRRVSE
ncbi:MAG: helix-turn-helix domain-containing protein [Bdellovibrionota bacterium]